MKFRLVLQPVMAIIFAARAAIKDAREGNPPYFWAMFTDATARRKLLQSGWKDVGKIFILAILIDAVYQFIVARWVYPGELVIVAIILAIVPYILVRGPLNRLLRRGK
jgi:Flp pilus assembly protein TadB